MPRKTIVTPAMEYLLNTLTVDRWYPSTNVEAKARAQGIPARSLDRARTALDVQARYNPRRKRWEMKLPKAHKPSSRRTYLPVRHRCADCGSIATYPIPATDT